MRQGLLFFQHFEPLSSTYTYILGDAKLGTAMIIDPVLETVDRDIKWLEEAGLKLKWIVETHIHADHLTGAGELRARTGAKIGVAATAGVKEADLQLKDGDEVGEGVYRLRVIATPGHTDTCLSYYGAGMVFTGDALLIRGTGRTDFQQGSAEKLYASVREKLFRLPEETIVYPAHDYKGLSSSTIAMEKKHNIRLGDGKSLDDYKRIMSELKLAPPKRINEAVPANLRLGVRPMNQIFDPAVVDGIPVVSVENVKANLGKDFRLIDVRRPEEFTGELGHVPGSELVPLGPELMRFLAETDKNKEIVFICRSGARSGQATTLSRDAGFAKTANMAGGMLRWNELGYSTGKLTP
jgi:glyoxylase-like metal-dependent hydrolase (beta-lactamase superfamily II)/rhodanese-related sulfurtransferase